MLSRTFLPLFPHLSPISFFDRFSERHVHQNAVCISSLVLRRSGVINRRRLSYRIELVNTLEDAEELERRVIDLLRRNELLNVKQISQELKAHPDISPASSTDSCSTVNSNSSPSVAPWSFTG
jgi:hypothetical protein